MAIDSTINRVSYWFIFHMNTMYSFVVVHVSNGVWQYQCQVFDKKVAIENQATNQLHFELSISCEYLCLILWCLSPINLGLFFKENSSNPILRWDYVIIRSVLVDDKPYNGSKALNALDLMQILCYLT